jgi:hypothetical protein
MTLAPGVYKFDVAASQIGDLTLDAGGDVEAAWTFQVGSALLFTTGSKVVFKDGLGDANKVTWQVGVICQYVLQ